VSSDQSTDGAVTSYHVAKGLGTTLLARLGAIIEIIAQPVYVWLFGLSSFGLYAVLWAAINLLENIFDFGMTSALQRSVPQSSKENEAADALRAALLFGVVPCALVAITISLAAEPLSLWLNVADADRDLVVPAIKIFIWALPLWAFVEIATSALRARHLFGPEIRLRIFWEQIIRLVLAVAFYLAGFGLTGLFMAHIASLAIIAVLSVRLLARHYSLRLLVSPIATSPYFGETVKAGLSVLPANMIARLFGDAPAIILNMLLPGAAGAQAGGLFTIARKLSSIVQLVRTAFVYVLAPLASSAEKAERAQVRDIYAYAVRLVTAIALPLAMVLAAGAMPLLGLFGREADIAYSAVVILLLARAIEAMAGISVPVLQVIGGFRHQLTASMMGLLVAMLIGWPLVQMMQPLTGITLAVSIGFVVTAAIPMVQLRIFEGLSPLGPDLAKTLARSGAVSVVALLLALAASRLPDIVAIPLVLLIALSAIWCSMRLSLSLHDRLSLGKVGQKLQLIPAA
jgi:O-antigen/teichoic acid export membrane protein